MRHRNETSEYSIVGHCPLCERDIPSGHLEKHHLKPKTFGGKETEAIHSICHRKIHSAFSERELLQYYFTVERILEREEMQKFVAWVKKKAIDFYDTSKDSVERKSKRRR
jgi:hypothetical protein